MEPILQVLLKLGLALLLSGVIGLEREVTGHKAGIRTLILVGIGAASFVMLGDRIELPDREMGRIIAGVATGIGFLGAGAIIKEGINIKGLTTAATIWVTASIGVSVGSGAYFIGLITFAFTMLVLTVFGIMERVFSLKPSSGRLVMVMEEGYGIPRKDLRKLRKEGLVIERMTMLRKGNNLSFSMDVELPKKLGISDFMERTERIKGIKSLEWEDSEGSSPMNYLDRF